MFCLTSSIGKHITWLLTNPISPLASYLQNNKFNGTIDVLTDLPLTDL
jgi:hypothetical protein